MKGSCLLVETIGRFVHAGLFRCVLASLVLALAGPALAQEQDSQLPAQPAGIEVEQVNINRADAETIAKVLDGIGMSRAEAIVTYRQENGNFNSVEDLLLVKGIGEVTLRRNVDKIRFD